ncbi:peptide/nickel transport system permease protein [Devosia lucknowensis]|uniref:Peptide/nickel transport system permease protein n=1 Tax=Devosia lucknowensis TaxID=1096929 RepID=A0A1Y6GC90_9HYPH|nr:ABC transporter permease [Devosia lucknowensis]SMQ85689.1 peptide/nickel transport system permease protein [Devosia lucknowensis]
MAGFIIKRLLQSILTIVGVITAAFFLTRLAGDPAILLLPPEATPEDAARLRAALGLDQPLFIQYLVFMGKAFTGDFGMSLRQAIPAMDLVLERVPATLELALSSFVVGIGLAFVLGILMRMTRHGWIRDVITWIALGRQAIPIFSFGLVLILIFSIQLKWLPSYGRGTFSHLILPALTLGTYELALYLRLFNASLAAEQRNDYVRTAFAKGQGRIQVLLKHMLPNALLPLVTVAGINLGMLLGGTVVTETVFSWPGVGRLIVQSVSQRDFPVIIAGVFLISLVFVVINLIVDILYGFLDPRVRLA